MPRSAEREIFFRRFLFYSFFFCACICKRKSGLDSLLQWGIDRFAEQTRLASPRQEQSCRRRRLRERFFEKSTFLVLFTDEKYQKSSKDFPSLENLPASSRFTLCKQSSPSGANIASEPSGNSLTSATGSKRPRADSDSLQCHVGLQRTSRELTDSRKRTRSASPRQGVQIWVLKLGSLCAEGMEIYFLFCLLTGLGLV